MKRRIDGSRLLALMALGACATFALPACSDDDEGGKGGSGATGGTAGNSSGGTGASSSGGSSGGGSGGTAGGGNCSAPADSSKAKACITLAPQPLTPGTDADIDGSGVAMIQIYDTATPEMDAANPVAPLKTIMLPDGGTGEVTLAGLTTQEADGLPDTVYIRAWFLDNPLAVQLVQAGSAPLVWGVFLGGADLSGGLSTSNPMKLKPVSLTTGAGTDITVPMVGFRKLLVTMSKGPAPYMFLGDGTGLGSWGAFQQRAVNSSAKPYGFGILGACADFNQAQVIPGAVVAECPGGTCEDTYVAGRLDDFGLSLDPNAGLLLDELAITANLDTSAGLLVPTDYKIDLSDPNKYDLGTLAIELTFNYRNDFGAPIPADPMNCPDTSGGAGGSGGSGGTTGGSGGTTGGSG
ncbi:MAG: hypothetical protein KC492_44595, partial [Myxococcales bacterium]|nr:hypothetical protein [Myxococcales bacterium]